VDRLSELRPVEERSVQYESGNAVIEAYMARPKAASKRPGVLVLHDDLGLNARFRELTHQLAEAGFVAMAPHLPSRSKTPASEPRDGRPQRAAVAGLPWYQTIDDVREAFKYLQQDPDVEAERISDDHADRQAPAPRLSAPAEQEAAAAASKDEKAQDEYAATGMGRRTGHAVAQVWLDLEDAPVQTVNIRYEFHPQLVRLGILPPAPTADPLQRRERAHGFAPGFCPEL
jgi:hypothetical protein